VLGNENEPIQPEQDEPVQRKQEQVPLVKPEEEQKVIEEASEVCYLSVMN